MATERLSQRMRPGKGGDFTIMDALRALSATDDSDWTDQLPADVIEATRQTERGFGDGASRSIALPPGLLFGRDLTVGTASAGGALVGHPKTLHALPLDNHSELAAAGLRVIPIGPGEVPSVPSVTLPVVAGVAATEVGAVPSSDAQFFAATPPMATVGVSVRVSRRLMRQGGAAGQRLIMDEIARAVGREIDRLVLQGSGSAGEPLGLFTLLASSPPVATATFEWPHVVSMTSLLIAKGIQQQNIRWIGSPYVRGVLANRARRLNTSSTTYEAFGPAIWDGNTIDGQPAFCTNECLSDGLIAADFSKIIMPIQGTTLIVDNRIDTAGTHLVVLLIDVGVVLPQAGAFVASKGIV